jgi:hypothetical protein
MKQQFVVTHTVRKTEIPPVTWPLGYKHTVCEDLVPIKNCFSLYFRKKAEVLVYWGPVNVFLCPVKLCIAGLRRTAVAWSVIFYIKIR